MAKRGRTRTPRLLVVAHLDPKKRGSLEQQLIALALRLGSCGVASSFLFARQPVPTLATELAATGATWSAIDFHHPLGAALAVASWARRWQPDLVHLHFVRPTSLVTLAAGAGARPLVMNEHLALRSGGPAPRRQLKWMVARATSALVARRVAVSQRVADTLVAEGVDPRRVRVVENGVDLSRFRAIDRLAARRGLGLPGGFFAGADGGDPPVIACVARMAPEKGVDVALRALARLRAGGGRARRAILLVAGDGPEQQDCERLAAALRLDGAVRFLGLRDDVERIVAASDQVWVPSRAEAFGLAAAEAMAGQRPVIASRAGALPEVVDDGRTGLLVPPDRPEELAAAAAALLADPERSATLGRAGRRRAEERYGLELHLDRLCQVYDELVPEWFAA